MLAYCGKKVLSSAVVLVVSVVAQMHLLLVLAYLVLGADGCLRNWHHMQLWFHGTLSVRLPPLQHLVVPGVREYLFPS